MLEKMRKWGLAEDAQARIMEKLITAALRWWQVVITESFVYDKIRYNKMGKAQDWAGVVDEEGR